ncbi:helix-turn-helix domain-containing protein [Meiothermus taiwanensis]|jgi:excisionase family DNA binding protein|uniref:DNA binding domain, excisionase family n=2 Tax=Meiothermus taiwanensis TaxID=172827 RepID=A0A399DXR7_9DEIN|nr:helix-turn-helix domain-containing protein [Meiothermus taiwanensis]AWR87996.1 excisionase [Meiothermus taiwanensis WR-220]KIQ54971.1 excisionase [Meiothermus taiwanensis]KZK15105.1 excisionase [Meiothermus taiwanensis]RIH76995.1 DNA binding domain, excisionase family [Meiothermus taiwanensis]
MNALTFSVLSKGQEQELRKFMKNLSPGKTLRLDGHSLELTPELVEILRQLLEPLARGEPVHILPLEAELSTQQAAEILGVSRPHLIRLLEEGKIPHRKVGTHRRVQAKDVLGYLEASKKQGRELLDQLITESQALGLDG